MWVTVSGAAASRQIHRRACPRVEIFTAGTIRDNLTLNVVNLLAPAQWPPIRVIHDWQSGAEGHNGERQANIGGRDE